MAINNDMNIVLCGELVVYLGAYVGKAVVHLSANEYTNYTLNRCIVTRLVLWNNIKPNIV